MEDTTRYQVPHTVQHTMTKWADNNMYKTSYLKMSETNVKFILLL